MRSGPVFLARRGYRLRRRIDALRLLPLAGTLLFLLPLLWSRDPDPSAGTPGLAAQALYLFGVWAALALAAALLGRGLGQGEEAEAPPAGRGR